MNWFVLILYLAYGGHVKVATYSSQSLCDEAGKSAHANFIEYSCIPVKDPSYVIRGYP